MRIHPFSAIRTPAHRASEVSCPPYDVVDRSEAVQFATKTNNFMRVIRPEVDFSNEQDPHSPAVYRRGQENLQDLITRKLMTRDSTASLYVYRQARSGRRQAGLVCCVDVEDYKIGDIRRHELTRPEKELDRMEHMLASGAHCEPVLLTVMGQNEFVRQLSRDMNHRPLLHFAAKDGVTHTLWSVQEINPYTKIFQDVQRMYIADGHHRCAAATRVAEHFRNSSGVSVDHESQRFPAVVFPGEELVILPYHRLARFAPGQTSEEVERKLAAAGLLEPISESVGPAPASRGEIGIFVNKTWWRFRFPPATGDSVLDQLDVVRISKVVLAPILRITDERTDPRISFLGGCSTEDLSASVLAGQCDIAFAMHATSIEELINVASANLIMPPKSTWFDPKIRSGLFVHSFALQSDVELPSHA